MGCASLSHRWGVHVKVCGRRFGAAGPRGSEGVWQRLEVVGMLAFRVVHFVELPEHAHEIRLSAHQQPSRMIKRSPQSS